MTGTAQGMLTAASIAAHRAVQSMVVGAIGEINSRLRPDRLARHTCLRLCVLAAKAHGRVILNGVYKAFKDADGLRAKCHWGIMGFDGKALIYPAQFVVANHAFAAKTDPVRRQIDACDAAIVSGLGGAVLDGKIVENLHILTAKALLAKAAAIVQLEDAR